MKPLKSLGCLAVSLFMLTACTKKEEKKIINLNPSAYGKPVNKKQLAEEIALAGEQLIDPARFMYADLLFDVALQTDPKNKRAGFYKSFIASFMSLRGLAKRVEAAVEKHGDAKAKSDFKRGLKNFPNSSLRSFLMDNSGKADLGDEAGLQLFLDEYRAGQNKFREFVKKNKDMKLTLNVNVLAAGAMIEDVAENCDASWKEKDQLEMAEKCDFLTALQVNLDRADLEALQHMQAGLQIFLSFLTAYDLSGMVELGELAKETLENQGRVLTDQETIEFARAHPTMGKLRSAKTLNSIVAMGSDAVAGVKWAHKIQSQLCPTGEEIRGNRKRNLIRTDICIQDSEETTVKEGIEIAESVLRNETIDYEMETETGRVIKTKIRPAAPFVKPVADLRTLAPTEFDACGNGTNLGDKTLGGIFPNGDAEDFSIWDSNCIPGTFQ